jgi:hypothetical protein
MSKIGAMQHRGLFPRFDHGEIGSEHGSAKRNDILTRKRRKAGAFSGLMRRQHRRLGRELFVLRRRRQRIVLDGVVDHLREQLLAERRQRTLP